MQKESEEIGAISRKRELNGKRYDFDILIWNSSDAGSRRFCVSFKCDQEKNIQICEKADTN